MTFTPPGQRPQNLDRDFDRTSLRRNGHGRTVHRDYAAHYFRWGFALRYIKKDTRVLDIGCGPDQPLPTLLTNHLAHVPEEYVGIDLNTIKKKVGFKWSRIIDEIDFTGTGCDLMLREYGAEHFDFMTCFEVIEHMHKDSGRALLENAWQLATEDAIMLLSTPVYNQKKMAANHIHEYTVPELQELIEDSGWEVVRRFGTFMNKNECKKVCTPEEWKLCEELGQFYSWEVLATFLAPKYPDHCRNNVWEITPQ